jgi:hypothetical protein
VTTDVDPRDDTEAGDSDDEDVDDQLSDNISSPAIDLVSPKRKNC